MKELQFTYHKYILDWCISMASYAAGLGLFVLAIRLVQFLPPLDLTEMAYLVLFAVLVFVGIALGLALGSLLAHFLGRRLCTGRGTARFYGEHLELCMGRRRYELPYRGLCVAEGEYSPADCLHSQQFSGPRYPKISLMYLQNGKAKRLSITASRAESWALYGGLKAAFKDIWRRGPRRPDDSSLDALAAAIFKETQPAGSVYPLAGA